MPQADASLPPEARSVSQVRRLARESAEGWGVEQVEWTLSQLVTELATNAVIHAGTSFQVRLSLSGGLLRCEVTDASPQVPRPRRYALEATTGRGLSMIEQLSDAWGVKPHAGGKTVWFELSLDDGETTEDLDEATVAADRPALDPSRRAVPRASEASAAAGGWSRYAA